MSDLLRMCENKDCVWYPKTFSIEEIEKLRQGNYVVIYQGKGVELRLCGNCAHAADTYHAFLKRVQSQYKV